MAEKTTPDAPAPSLTRGSSSNLVSICLEFATGFEAMVCITFTKPCEVTFKCLESFNEPLWDTAMFNFCFVLRGNSLSGTNLWVEQIKFVLWRKEAAPIPIDCRVVRYVVAEEAVVADDRLGIALGLDDGFAWGLAWGGWWVELVLLLLMLSLMLSFRSPFCDVNVSSCE